MITNLNTASPFATRDDQFEGLDKLSNPCCGPADRRSDIATGTACVNAAAGTVADLFAEARQPLHDTVVQTDRFGG